TMDTGLDVAGDGRGVKGVIDITDIRVDADGRLSSTKTVITREGGNVVSTTTASSGGTHTVTGKTARGATLNLLGDTRYVWETGQDLSTATYWAYKGVQFLGSGSLRTKPSGSVVKEDGPYALGRPVVLDDGRYLGNDSSTNHLNTTTDTYQLSDQWVKTGEKSNCNWWTLCIAQNYTMYFTQSEVNKEVKTNSMRANYGIGIDFIGQDQGAVNVTSNSSVAVTGNISNAHGNTAITATGDLTAT